MSQEVTTTAQEKILAKLEWIDSRLERIEVKQNGLRELLQKLIPTNDGKKERPLRIGLTANQVEVFEKIDKIEFGDRGATQKIQDLLNTLVKNVVTEVLTLNIKYILKQSGLGIQCPTCDEAASPTWRKDSRYMQGGCMQFSHTIEVMDGAYRRSTSHSGMTEIHALTLIVKKRK